MREEGRAGLERGNVPLLLIPALRPNKPKEAIDDLPTSFWVANGLHLSRLSVE